MAEDSLPELRRVMGAAFYGQFLAMYYAIKCCVIIHSYIVC